MRNKGEIYFEDFKDGAVNIKIAHDILGFESKFVVALSLLETSNHSIQGIINVNNSCSIFNLNYLDQIKCLKKF